jgi:hypothetical protein
MDDKRLTLARSPNTGYWMTQGGVGGTAFRYPTDTVQPWSNLRDANAVVYHIWETSILQIARIEPATRTISFTGPSKWAFGWYGKQRFVIENHEGALDAPGEWQLDRDSGVLSLMPPSGVDPRKAVIVAPALESLVEFAGDPERGQAVHDVVLRGLSFQHAEWPLPPDGHGDWQAAVTVPAAVRAVGAVNCRIEGCEVAHVGGYGISLGAGCMDCVVRRCRLRDLGAGGVKIGRPEATTGPLATGRCTVDNCFIHDGGHIHPGAVGVWVGQSSDNTISHNEICDLNYTGISVGWSWGYAPTTCHRNRIEFNHLHHLGRQVMSDMGAIYTLGISTGTVIRNNLIHEIWGHETSGSGGIYPDEGTTGVLIENNVVYGTIYGGFSIHYGRDITARNNVFALSRDRQMSRGRADKQTTFAFERNIVYYDRGDLMAGNGEITSSGGNVYWHAGRKPVLFQDGDALADWQAKGHDRTSVVADPQFVDPRRFDFRLRPGSPALKLGFRPINTDLCGLYGPKSWVALPKAIRRPPFAFPKPPSAGPLALAETFEDEPPGVTADKAVTYGEAGEAMVRVTDEAAASGAHSLKFTDAAGMDFPFNPHIWYVPRVEQGVVTVSFDLRTEPGGQPCVEWRDAESPYHAGPSLSVGPDGLVSAAGKPVGKIEHSRWAHFEMRCRLGPQATGTWSLRASGAGLDLDLADLPADPRMRSLHWLGFVANATQPAVFYVDNIVMRVAAAKPPPR